MARRLNDRLRALELQRPAAGDEEAAAWCNGLIQHLDRNHERGPGESWADVAARLWGFESSRALRSWLARPQEGAR